jgi:hypothetical protein
MAGRLAVVQPDGLQARVRGALDALGIVIVVEPIPQGQAQAGVGGGIVRVDGQRSLEHGDGAVDGVAAVVAPQVTPASKIELERPGQDRSALFQDPALVGVGSHLQHPEDCGDHQVLECQGIVQAGIEHLGSQLASLGNVHQAEGDPRLVAEAPHTTAEGQVDPELPGRFLDRGGLELAHFTGRHHLQIGPACQLGQLGGHRVQQPIVEGGDLRVG